MDEKSQYQLAMVAVSDGGNENNPPQIFKLDVDCVQEIFDFLSFGDIKSVSKTCVRMHRIAFDYSKSNFAGMRPNLRRSHTNGFEEVVWNFYIPLGYDMKSVLQCKSLKHISFSGDSMYANDIRGLRPILGELESLEFTDFLFYGDFYKDFLQFCPKLIKLQIKEGGRRGPSYIMGTSDCWLLRSYPTLQCLKLNLRYRPNISNLRTFFQLNPTLETFSMDGFTFHRCINTMLQANINLQILSITRANDKLPMEIFCNHLNQLRSQGFYQKLHIEMNYSNQEKTNTISSLLVMEELSIVGSIELPLNISLSLKHLILIHPLLTSTNLESIAKRLVNLERLTLAQFESKMLEPFIQYSIKLKTITISSCDDIENLDLVAWNQKREKLLRAQKLTFYLFDNDYLAVKWRNNSSDFKMIQIKRAESVIQ